MASHPKLARRLPTLLRILAWAASACLQTAVEGCGILASQLEPQQAQGVCSMHWKVDETPDLVPGEASFGSEPSLLIVMPASMPMREGHRCGGGAKQTSWARLAIAEPKPVVTAMNGAAERAR